MATIGRLWCCLGLVFGSPVVATALANSVALVLERCGMSNGSAVLIVIYGNGALAVAGAAAGMMFVQEVPVVVRSICAVLLAPPVFIAYRVMTAVAAVMVFGW